MRGGGAEQTQCPVLYLRESWLRLWEEGTVSPIPFSQVGRMEKDGRASLFNLRESQEGIQYELTLQNTLLLDHVLFTYNLSVFPEHHGKLKETEETQFCPPTPYRGAGGMTDKYMMLTNFKHELSVLFSHITL